MNLHNRLLSYEKMTDDVLPPIDWIIDSLIPPKSRIVVFGEFGSKKSWLLLDMGLHIAAGIQWLDRFVVPQPRSVLYVDEEMSEYELCRRIQLLGADLQIPDNNIPFRVTSQLGLGFRGKHNSEYLLAGLKAEGFDPDVIIIETLRRVLTGSENEAADVSAFWRYVTPIVEAGKTLIISHHMRKVNLQFKGEESRNRASGSTDILAGADCAFAVTRAENDLIKVECVKSRAAREPEAFICSLIDGDDGQSAYLTTNTEYIMSPKQATEYAAVHRMMVEHFEVAEWQSLKTATLYNLLGMQGIGRRTAERAFRTLKTTGRVELVKPNTYRLKTLDVA